MINLDESSFRHARERSKQAAADFGAPSASFAVDYGISGQYVTRLLDQAAIFRGYPSVVRTDNWPEFTSRAFLARAQSHGAIADLHDARFAAFTQMQDLARRIR